MGMGVIQAASQGAFNASPYVSSGLSNSFTQPPSNPYAPAGTGYSNVNNPAPAAGGNMEGRYEIRKMASGGLSSAAQHLASKGRNGDSMLVHMTPGEVKGLQALAMAHGGSLRINPNTGLPEASFLKNILPMIAGAALTPFLGPMGAALATGGFETIRTGDIGKGLTAGLGAFGGGNLATGLSAAAPEAVTSVGTQATPIAENVAANAGGVKDLFGLPGSSSIPGASSVASNFQATAPTSFANMQAGAQNLYNTPGGVTDFLGSNKMNLAMAASPIVSDAMTPKVPGVATEEEDPRYKGSPYNYRLASDFRGYTPATPNPYYRPTGLGYAAQGGSTTDIMMAAGGSYDDEPRGDDQGFGYAAGGQLGGYSDGGRMLKGPGDGMSDSIPGVIGNKQPARLADGEFVVPADVVSHLGNGSTDAGAKRLYGMMDKVRKARTGTKKQGKQIKPEKYMPA